MPSNLEVLTRLTLDNTQFKAGLSGAQARMQSAASSMKSAGTTMSSSVTLPAVAAGGFAVKKFADFDDAMTESLAIMGDVSSRMRDDMSDAARQVATTTAMSADEAAESYFFLASAGLDAAESVEALPEVAAFAQAGTFDMAKATDIATDAQSALGLAVDDTQQNIENLTRVQDTFVKANQLANASVEQFGEAMTNKLGARLNQTNKSVEEGTAALAALADQGVKGRRAGSKLNILLRDLQKRALENADAFRDFGIQVFDAQGNMRNIADIMEDVEGATGGMSDKARTAALEQLGLSRRAADVAAQLTGTSGAIKTYQADLENAAGATEEVADNQLDSFSKQWGLLKDQVIDVAIEIGSTLAPFLTGLREDLAAATEWVRNLNDSKKRLAIAVVGVAAAIGPLLLVLGTLTGALASLLSPLGAAVAALGAFGAATVHGIAKAEGASGMLDRLGALFGRAKAAVQGFVDAAKPVAKSVFDALVQRGRVLWDVLKSLVGTVAALAPTVQEGLATAWEAVSPVVERAQEAFVSAGEWLQDTLPGVIDSAVSVLSGLFSAVDWTSVGDAAGAAFDTVKNALTTVRNVAQEIGPEVKSFLESLVDAGEDVAAELGPALESIMQNVSETDFSALADAFVDIAEKALELGEKALPKIVTVVDEVLDVVVPLVNKLIDFTQALLENKTAVMAIVGAFAAFKAVMAAASIASAIAGIVSAAGSFITTAPAIGAALTTALGPIGLLAAAIAALVAIGVVLVRNWGTIKSAAKSVWSSIASTVGGWVEKVQAKVAAAWEAVKNVTETLWEGVKAAVEFATRALVAYFLTFTPLGRIVDFAIDNWDTITTVTKKAWAKVREFILEPIASATTWVVQRLGQFVGWLGEKWTTIKEAAKKAWKVVEDNIVDPVKSAAGTVVSKAQEIVDTLKEKWNTLKRKTGQIWSKIKAKIVDPITDLIDKAKSWGEDIIQGFIDGLKDKIEPLTNAAGSVVDEFKENFNDPLGVKSPSTWAMNLGEEVVAGLELGVEPAADPLNALMDPTRLRRAARSRDRGGGPQERVLRIDRLVLEGIQDAEELFRELERLRGEKLRSSGVTIP